MKLVVLYNTPIGKIVNLSHVVSVSRVIDKGNRRYPERTASGVPCAMSPQGRLAENVFELRQSREMISGGFNNFDKSSPVAPSDLEDNYRMISSQFLIARTTVFMHRRTSANLVESTGRFDPTSSSKVCVELPMTYHGWWVGVPVSWETRIDSVTLQQHSMPPRCALMHRDD